MPILRAASALQQGAADSEHISSSLTLLEQNSNIVILQRFSFMAVELLTSAQTNPDLQDIGELGEKLKTAVHEKAAKYIAEVDPDSDFASRLRTIQDSMTPAILTEPSSKRTASEAQASDPTGEHKTLTVKLDRANGDVPAPGADIPSTPLPKDDPFSARRKSIVSETRPNLDSAAASTVGSTDTASARLATVDESQTETGSVGGALPATQQVSYGM
ncbi:hypothetical protein F4604DRAFT_1918637 [Suillus subluteus]|nr:hypothetical protein F4604DRAFT_1918637 [Suillus subluteus]